jgi:hypothetical protein
LAVATISGTLGRMQQEVSGEPRAHSGRAMKRFSWIAFAIGTLLHLYGTSLLWGESMRYHLGGPDEPVRHADDGPSRVSSEFRTWLSSLPGANAI